MKIKEFVRISPDDLAAMTKAELQKIAKQGATYSNRRIAGLVNAGGSYSPAFASLPASVRKTQKFTVPEKANKDRMIRLIQSQQIYLRSKYSTGKEWSKVSAKIEKEYGRTYTNYRYTVSGDIMPVSKAKKLNIPTLSRKQINTFWQVFHKYQELYPEIFVSKYDAQGVYDKIVDILKETPNVSADKALQYLKAGSKKAYEQAEAERNKALESIRSGGGTKF